MPAGRPPKQPVVPLMFAVAANASMAHTHALSERIALALHDAPGPLSDELAQIAVSYELNAQIQRDGPLTKKRQGRRAEMHLSILIAQCAKVHERTTGEAAASALRKIGGWAESAGVVSPVVTYTNAVLEAVGVKRPQSLRTQVRNAIDLV